MVTDAAGRSWFNHWDRLFDLQKGQMVPLAGPQAPAELVAKDVCTSRDGGLWVVTPNGLRKYRQGQWLSAVWPCPDFKTAIVASHEDAAGNLWLATYDNGLFRFNPEDGWKQLTVASGLTTLRLRCLFGDREGNLWVGTDGGGVMRIKPRPWKMITRREGLGIDAVQSVCEDQQGRMWFVGGTSKPYWLDQGVVSSAIPSPQSDVIDSAWAILPARDGTMWIGTYHGNAFHYRDGILTRYGNAEGMRAGSVRALLEDRQGALWVGGFSGLCRIKDGHATHYAQREGLRSERVWALAEDSNGDLYVGTQGGGLSRYRDGHFTTFTRKDGLPSDWINALHMDSEDALWIGTHSGGLSRFKAGRVVNFGVKRGIPARDVGPIVEDDDGQLWMVTGMGILRVSKRELNEFAAGTRRAVSYVVSDRNDGLATLEVGGTQPACLKARNGTLWFGTAKGAAWVDPQKLHFNPSPPPVVIEEVLIDDKALPNRGAEGGDSRTAISDESPEDGGAMDRPSASLSSPPALVTVWPRQNRVEFRFTALSFTAPGKVRFRYQLEGLDENWVDAGTKRVAYYTRLPVGRYRFRVTACNDSGVWNETGASLAVVVAPAFHQTWWFKLLGIAAVAGLVSTLFLIRLARLKQLARLRGRIAGDLHDEIGSNIGGIILLSELTQQTPALTPDARASLEEINATAHRTATAMRDIVWFLNPDFDTLADMVARMKEFATTLLNGVACEFTVPDLASAPSLTIEFRRNVFFSFKEILHNIVKHAGASKVGIRLDVSGRQIALRVHDNGRGFDTTQAASGHGLQSLRRRAADLGGHLAVESEPGKGTTVVITVMLR
jgi:ligand-binding sensor domain-containing protein/signal transduction histidine kinase